MGDRGSFLHPRPRSVVETGVAAGLVPVPGRGSSSRPRPPVPGEDSPPAGCAPGTTCWCRFSPQTSGTVMTLRGFQVPKRRLKESISTAQVLLHSSRGENNQIRSAMWGMIRVQTEEPVLGPKARRYESVPLWSQGT